MQIDYVLAFSPVLHFKNDAQDARILQLLHHAGALNMYGMVTMLNQEEPSQPPVTKTRVANRLKDLVSRGGVTSEIRRGHAHKTAHFVFYDIPKA